MAGEGIPGIAVAAATAGGLLIYAGLQGLTPIEALMAITSGTADPLTVTSASFANDPTGIGRSSGLVAVSTGGLAGGTHPEIAQAALKHAHERYSQPKRWQPGFSDCSSFVGKSLKDVGITPPGGSVTTSYLAWRQLKTIPRADIGAGDILCSSGHVAIALSATEAIGQQNGRQNVVRGPIERIMSGQPSWVPRRYIGKASSSGLAEV